MNTPPASDAAPPLIEAFFSGRVRRPPVGDLLGLGIGGPPERLDARRRALTAARLAARGGEAMLSQGPLDLSRPRALLRP